MSTEKWHRVEPVDVPDEGRVRSVTVDGRTVALARCGGSLGALENRCPHIGLPLGRGKIEGDEIVCPFHGSRFDIRTGENTDWVAAVAGVKIPPWSRALLSFGKKPHPVRTFPVSVEAGAVFVDV